MSRNAQVANGLQLVLGVMSGKKNRAVAIGFRNVIDGRHSDSIALIRRLVDDVLPFASVNKESHGLSRYVE